MIEQRIENRPRLFAPRVPGEYQLLHAPRKLADLGYVLAAVQPTYTDAASVTDRGVAAPDSVIVFDQASGDFLDGVGSVDLVLTGSWLRQQTALGIFNGTDHVSTKCAETEPLPGVGDKATADAALASTYDLTTSGKLAFSVQFRASVDGQVQNEIVRKLEATGIDGWGLSLITGGLQFRVDDGTTVVSTTVTANFTDGAPHRATVLIDKDNDTIDLWTDLGDATQASISAIPDMSVSLPFGVGRRAGSSNGMMGQYIDIIVWSTNADQIDATTNAKLQPHSGDPGQTKLTTKTHGLWHDSLGTDAGGAILGTFSEDAHVAIGMGASQLGLHSDVAVENLCPESDDFSAWTAAACTVAANNTDSPRRFREATRLTQTAGGGHVKLNITGLTAQTEYTISLWLKADTTETVGVDARNAANTANLATTTFAAVSTWKRFSLTFTTAAAETAMWIRLFGGTGATADKTSMVAHVNLHLGANALRHVPTAGAAATSAKSIYQVATANGEHVRGSRGEIEVVYSMDADTGVARRLFDIYNGTSNADRKYGEVQGNESVRTRLFDSAGASTDLTDSLAASDPTATMRMRWDSAGLESGNFTEQILDGAIRNGAAVTFTANDTPTQINVGNQAAAAAAAQLSGHLHSLTIYDRPRREVL